ncbi:MAG: hypothetical protein OXC40_03345 [Proteobacteria bacterium]|nr:hypothetical protein [Pseudomonadota bacterium]
MVSTYLNVGWVAYSNIYPVSSSLAHYLDQEQVPWFEGVPAVINRALREGQLQVALSSSVNYFKIKQCERFVDYGICADGAVGSVYLGMKAAPPDLIHHLKRAQGFCQQHPVNGGESLAELKRALSLEYHGDLPPLKLGAVSESSAILALIMYHLWFGRSPDLPGQTTRPPRGLRQLDPLESLTSYRQEDFSPGEFHLMIGDEAFRYSNEFDFKIDLSLAWQNLTSLPFVFSLWLHVPRYPYSSAELSKLEKIKQLIHLAIQQGERYIEEASQKGDFTGLLAPNAKIYFDAELSRYVDLIKYWRDTIYYRVGPREKKSFALYSRLAQEVTSSSPLDDKSALC